MDKETDEELLGQYMEQGDTRILDRLVLNNIGAIRGVIYAMVLSHEDADDLTQEVFLKAFGGLERFDHRARFSSWLYRIAINASKDFLRRKHRNPSDPLCMMPEVADHGPGPDHTLMGREAEDEISRALATLSPPLRAAIVLTAIQGLSAREAAAIDNCPTATMHWRVHQARKMLRRRLRPMAHKPVKDDAEEANA